MSIGPTMVKVGVVRYREEDAILLGIHPSQAKRVKAGKPQEATPLVSGEGEPGMEGSSGDFNADHIDSSGGDTPSGPPGAGRKAPPRATRRPPKSSQQS